MGSFRGEKGFLSNMYDAPFVVGTTLFKTSEHFYQAHLAASMEGYAEILNASTPAKAKRLSRELPRTPEYKAMRLTVMAQALYFKFLAHTNLQERLLAIPDEELVEQNEWHDNYWGNCTCDKCKNIPGQNHLGKLLILTKSYFASLKQLERS